MKRLKYLLIDDDSDDREFFRIALESLVTDFTLTTAENGVIALEILQSGRHQFDYIFLDLNMPLLNGKEFLNEVKKETVTVDAPIIIYSTSSYSKDIEETQKLGATNFISKTSDLPALASIISDITRDKTVDYYLNI